MNRRALLLRREADGERMDPMIETRERASILDLVRIASRRTREKQSRGKGGEGKREESFAPMARRETKGRLCRGGRRGPTRGLMTTTFNAVCM